MSAIKEWLEYRSGLKNIIDMDAVFFDKNGKRLNENNIQDILEPMVME